MQVADQLSGIGPDTVDEARLPTTHERQAHEVEPGDVADTPVMRETAARVESTSVEPWKRRPMTGRPHHGRESVHVELGGYPPDCGWRWDGRGQEIAQALFGRELVDAGQESLLLQIRGGHEAGQSTGELRPAV